MALDNVLWLENAGAVYNAVEYRHLAAALLGPTSGVLSPNDLKVTQRGAGANMSVDVAAGDAAIFGTESSPEQGCYYAHSSAVTNLVIAAADAGPRYDRIVAKVQDSDYSGGTNTVSIVVVNGTAVRPAEPALPANCVELARVLVPAGSSSVVTANIVDRRVLTGPETYGRGRLAFNAMNATSATSGGTAKTVTDSAISVAVRAGAIVKYEAVIRVKGNTLNDVFTVHVERDGTLAGTQVDIPITRTDVPSGSVYICAWHAQSSTSESKTYNLRIQRGIGSGTATIDDLGWVSLTDMGAQVPAT